jgi:hypothetical protein
MAIATYSDLKTKIADYLGRTDLTSQIPDFITFAENRLRRDLRIRQMLKLVNATMTANDATVSLPNDFLEIRDIHLNTTPIYALEYLSPNIFYRNTDVTNTGVPRKYTVLADDFQFAPIPDSAYNVRMLYYAAPAYLSDTNTSNAFLANCPDALLYAALGEAEPYLMNDERLATWAALYQRAIDSINASDDRGEYAGVPLTMTLARR